MIIVRISDGLGNQMFQYAMGRHLAEQQKTVLKLDLSSFTTNKNRQYGLDAFKIDENIATRQEIDPIRGAKIAQFNQFSKKVFPKLRLDNFISVKLPLPISYYKESTLNFDSSLQQKSRPLYLEGFWQSEKYFSGSATTIRREFEIKYAQDDESSRITEEICKTNAISLHVRRTDYVDPRLQVPHGTCDQAYYDRAIQHVTASVTSPHFFVFSDDPAWVKANLQLNGHPATFVEHNGDARNYEDLRLMSQCQHHIIANSTFSWWGAWLNPSPEKIVVAPQRWFATALHQSQSYDLVPAQWVKL